MAVFPLLFQKHELLFSMLVDHLWLNNCRRWAKLDLGPVCPLASSKSCLFKQGCMAVWTQDLKYEDQTDPYRGREMFHTSSPAEAAAGQLCTRWLSKPEMDYSWIYSVTIERFFSFKVTLREQTYILLL